MSKNQNTRLDALGRRRGNVGAGATIETPKSYRCTGTIFDEDLGPIREDVARLQRAEGLFFRHGVNPNAVVGDGTAYVTAAPGAHEVTVHYLAIVCPEGSGGQWGGSSDGRAPFPAGVVCDNASDRAWHKAATRETFTAKWAEVAL